MVAADSLSNRASYSSGDVLYCGGATDIFAEVDASTTRSGRCAG